MGFIKLFLIGMYSPILIIGLVEMLPSFENIKERLARCKCGVCERTRARGEYAEPH